MKDSKLTYYLDCFKATAYHAAAWCITIMNRYITHSGLYRYETNRQSWILPTGFIPQPNWLHAAVMPIGKGPYFLDDPVDKYLRVRKFDGEA